MQPQSLLKPIIILSCSNDKTLTGQCTNNFQNIYNFKKWMIVNVPMCIQSKIWEVDNCSMCQTQYTLKEKLCYEFFFFSCRSDEYIEVHRSNPAVSEPYSTLQPQSGMLHKWILHLRHKRLVDHFVFSFQYLSSFLFLFERNHRVLRTLNVHTAPPFIFIWSHKTVRFIRINYASFWLSIYVSPYTNIWVLSISKRLRSNKKQNSFF